MRIAKGLGRQMAVGKEDSKTNIIISSPISACYYHLYISGQPKSRLNQMQNTSTKYPQASSGIGSTNQQSFTSRSQPSNIFTRNVTPKQDNKPNTGLTGPSPTTSPATLGQLLSSNTESSFIPTGYSQPSRLTSKSDVFAGSSQLQNTQGQSAGNQSINNASKNSSNSPPGLVLNKVNMDNTNAINIFSKSSNPNTPYNPFLSSTQKSAVNTSKCFPNQITPTFNQNNANLSSNNPPLQKSYQTNPNFPINNPPSFSRPSFQASVPQMMENMYISEPRPVSSSPFNYYNIKLMIAHLQEKIGKYCDSRLSIDIRPELKEKKIKEFKTNEILSIIFQVKTYNDSLETLKEEMEELQAKSDQLISNLEQRLLSRKNSLADKIKWRILLQDIEGELMLIETQLRDFIRPLFSAYHSGKPIRFQDPDSFSIKVATSIKKRITRLQGSINELSTQALTSADSILQHEEENSLKAHSMIAQLTQHFQEICIRFELLKEQYIRQIKPSWKYSKQPHNEVEQGEFFKTKKCIKEISKVLEQRLAKIEQRFAKKTAHSFSL